MHFPENISLDFLNQLGQGCLPGHLGISFIETSKDNLKATMPVDERTKQPMGLLHGGASVVLAETLGSVASQIITGNPGKYQVVGVEINANHLRSAKNGLVTGTVKAVKLGRRLHVWNIDIRDHQDRLICVSRLTVMVTEMT